MLLQTGNLTGKEFDYAGIHLISGKAFVSLFGTARRRLTPR